MPLSGAEVQAQLVRAMTPEQKLGVSQALHDFAWELKAAWLRTSRPDLSYQEVVHDRSNTACRRSSARRLRTWLQFVTRLR